ncbi:heat shock factor binding protein 1-domain-containing protein [Kalaharituber pfeilii]|nr:heat shock factor binding protein 1-domain-containing protein [Kalaharituber pfeilii]
MSSPAKPEDTKSKPQDAPAELTAVVDDLLNSLSQKFATVSSEIFEKMDAMSKRLDAIEAALSSSGSGK